MASPVGDTKSQKPRGPASMSAAKPTDKPAGKSAGKPPPRAKIPDEDEEAPPVAEPTGRGGGIWKIIGMLMTAALGLGLASYSGFYYSGMTIKSSIETKVLLAIDHHTALHLRDGGSVTEMAMVDSIRHCIPDVALSPQFIARNGLKDVSGDAIVRAAERYCLSMILMEVARNEVIALEAVRHRAETEANLKEVSRHDDYLHFILTFAKIKGYTIPEEYKDFHTDSAILNRFSNGVDH